MTDLRPNFHPSGCSILSPVRDIPFNKLVLSQSNVRKVKGGQSIADLAEDIARRGLLQSLAVRPVLTEDGAETGTFEVPVGGRRFRALELLVKKKRLPRTAPIPCIVHADGAAEEDSLAENVHREALHPLDQFRAFQALRDKGLSEEDIAARFFVTPAVVRQRLRLAGVSPRLLELYAEGEMALDDLMAFTVSGDHARQEQVWDLVSQNSWNRHPAVIRRLLTETAIRADDRRARFVGAEAYADAGGTILRDLFSEDGGGWFEDMALLERLVAEALNTAAEQVRAEGWLWVEAALDFPYGHTHGLRRLAGEAVDLTEEEIAARRDLQAELEKLLGSYPEPTELPDDVDARVGEIEAALEVFETRPVRFDPGEMTRAGVFVSIDMDGQVRIERGFIRPEDDVVSETSDTDGDTVADGDAPDSPAADPSVPANDPGTSEPGEDPAKPLSDRLIAELTAHRTLALREALGRAPETAFLAVLHALCLSAFRAGAADTSLEITGRSAPLTIQGSGLRESAAARALEARYTDWAARLPGDPAGLWAFLEGLADEERMALLAHCAARTVNAVVEPWKRSPGRIRHADVLARAVSLDMDAAGWSPTADTYLGRVTKARILEAVREAKGERAAARIEHLRKTDMAEEAARLLAGTGWLPEPLRMPDLETPDDADPRADETNPPHENSPPHEEWLDEAAE
ncbi:ParB/RepB/Spo0J family partition protein [Roseospira visakhapatnamensis]|uniref:ParB/RepB/Spo0J family partition protein n=1 Tax=Roseospira visakhapatnamensis TaxID=390880 RepID=UPI001C8500BF|nr:ParB/RepB/Spo0J family partition protein [Roseospira visakhapatnamensis]